MANGLLAQNGGAQEFAKANPNGRLGRPEDIAGVVVYLASRAGSHVNGANIVVDGGEWLSRKVPRDVGKDEEKAKAKL
ncbi:hypothetical protein DSL72_007663 [Monilinia vaccinii-corymbosi]|uniref:Uncharacterized protein n=1 Tax=Monilinia vaccinii-corymbosi TaxID=61207 RepID=A0A8A3PIE5_9HELO|nr:hypothetical protein DSL72_007663 [Monilinia vaccinii-corymbosi]